MDKLDIAIIRELTQSGVILPGRPGTAPSYRQVSKKLGIPFGTIRNRINAMYRAGVLKGSSLFPNPSLFNLKAEAFTFDISHELNKVQVFKKLKSVEGVLSGHNFIGSRAWIVFFYMDEQDLERKLLLFRDIVGSDGIRSRIPFPPCPTTFTQSEARLILELAKSGLVGYKQLGRKLGTSERSIKRTMSKVIRENKILSIPIVDYTAISESVPADLLIFFEDDAETRALAEPKVLDLVKDHVILAALFDIVGMCSLVLPRVAQLSELADKVRQIKGVRDAWVEIVEEHMHQGQILAKYLEK